MPVKIALSMEISTATTNFQCLIVHISTPYTFSARRNNLVTETTHATRGTLPMLRYLFINTVWMVQTMAAFIGVSRLTRVLTRDKDAMDIFFFTNPTILSRNEFEFSWV